LILQGDEGLWIAATLLLDVVLGGVAAASVGRALARAWRPFAAAWPCAIALAGAVGFLHYAIFGLSPIPIYDIGATLAGFGGAPAASALRLAADLSGWAALSVLSLVFAAYGYRRMRRRQMLDRYDWLYEPAGLFAWRPRAPTEQV
jgi:hypothetical protein